jgi:hydrogenase-4 component C
VATGMMPISLAFWLGMAAFAFATFVEMGKLPFDLAEAEQELQEGPLSEYSGHSLALVKWSLYLKQHCSGGFFFALFSFGSMTNSRWLALVYLVAFLIRKHHVLFVVALLNAMPACDL